MRIENYLGYHATLHNKKDQFFAIFQEFKSKIDRGNDLEERDTSEKNDESTSTSNFLSSCSYCKVMFN